MPAASARWTGFQFRALVFLGAFLMFQGELIVARRILPEFGSTASVWTTCLMFFQALLLLGYVYAATLGPRMGATQTVRWTHRVLVLAPLATFPFRFPKLELPPFLAVVGVLGVSVGFSFFALSTTSVLAQRWFGQSEHPHRADPFFLYGTSNLGSLVALLSYPLLVEPALGMRAQLSCWYVGYALFAVLHLRCMSPRGVSALAATVVQSSPSSTADRWLWTLLAAAGTALMTAVTHVITLDASIPLLWVVPLTVYLATLIIAFARKPLSFSRVRWICVASLVLAASMVLLGRLIPSLFQLSLVLLHTSLLGVGCLLCHWNLARARPASSAGAGGYYLCIALGGWLGTALIVVGVPVLLGRLAIPYLDYLIAGAVLLASLLVRDRAKVRAWSSTHRLAAASAMAVSALFLGIIGLGMFAAVHGRVDGVRTFYGLYQVKDQRGLRWFHHGNTVHGVEALAPAERGKPLGYYHRESPIGQLLDSSSHGPRVGVVGLGVGGLAAYAREGERWDFFELDPEVERLARAHFTFLTAPAGKVTVLTGDARLSLAAIPSGAYDLLIIDAFSSDFIPTHLLTLEAVQLYLDRLAPRGLLVFHISNRAFELRPVLATAAATLALPAAWKGELDTDEQYSRGAFGGLWFAISRDPKTLETLGWTPAPAPEKWSAPWTDDYVDLLRALR